MKKFIIFLTAGFLTGISALAQDPQATEDWTKKPDIVKPGCRKAPPSDALVLFGKAKDLANWTGRDGEAAWKSVCRKMTVNGTGEIATKEKFGDCQLHIEFRTPAKVSGEGQGRGNSGVFLQSLYEVQVLDSYENITYYNGQAGSIYKQSAPLVNAARKPGRWQAYDIIFHAPKFAADSSLVAPATLTVFHNGVLIQDHFEIKGPTTYVGLPKYQVHGEMPLMLQDHGNPVSYRNIWIRKL